MRGCQNAKNVKIRSIRNNHNLYKILLLFCVQEVHYFGNYPYYKNDQDEEIN